MDDLEEKKARAKYNILSLFVYIIGSILLIQLFNLQIIKGHEYREQSNTRLTRESVIQAARGNILDRTGNKIVSNTMGFRLDLYRTKVDTDTLNESILKIITDIYGCSVFGIICIFCIKGYSNFMFMSFW